MASTSFFATAFCTDRNFVGTACLSFSLFLGMHRNYAVWGISRIHLCPTRITFSSLQSFFFLYLRLGTNFRGWENLYKFKIS